MFCHYFEGTPFAIRIDHSSNKWMLNFADDFGFLAQWRLRPFKIEFNAVHRADTKHKAAEALVHLQTNGADTDSIEDGSPFTVIDTENSATTKV